MAGAPGEGAAPPTAGLSAALALEAADAAHHHYRVTYRKSGWKHSKTYHTYSSKKSAEKAAHHLHKHGYHVHVKTV